MRQYQYGFTLVELAIVLTIIGLLIGGILKGMEMMQNARANATIAEVKALGAAVTTFKDIYNAYPGDMLLAGRKLRGCPGTNGAACNPRANQATSGDKIVGRPNWGPGWALQRNATRGLLGGNNVADETYLFWSHLLLADLIAGVTADGLNVATPFAFGVTHPSAPVGGGFVAGYGNGGVGRGSPATAGSGPQGLIIALVSSPATAMGVAANAQPLSPGRSAMLDRKIDDGYPTTGLVQAYGRATNCFSAATPYSATKRGYRQTVSQTDCGLLFSLVE